MSVAATAAAAAAAALVPTYNMISTSLVVAVAAATVTFGALSPFGAVYSTISTSTL
jgi:hypothetical protein